MGYEARMDAASDYASEVGHDMFVDGEFDDEIQERILEGDFDDTVKQRYEMLKK